ncbi:zinc finger MYM-type protein 1-like [Papaver somniferum]|uniref:zinc finger MYM-type protein 1-like n=1 Tax=Papaver somniferum TaxID=3469 RepID=UPI000E6F7AF7|nr:zinc finger MYM-type protein 1-like [Papaver somniferum]
MRSKIHGDAVKALEDLKNPSQHIERVVESYTSQQVAENRLRLRTSIDAVLWLTFQGYALRGRDESQGSLNRDSFLEMINILASYNKDVEAVLDKAPKNATYTSPQIQKEILHVIAAKVKKEIREEIGDRKFCLIVDEASDESKKKEKMAIVLRFVDKNGLIQERFFGLVHVSDTTALTLKQEIYSVLTENGLDVQNIRGQGYDGASNMRGEWHGLQALIMKDCPYAYYIHCLAHRLQLALVAEAKEVIPVDQFFIKLNMIINIVGASSKRKDELMIAQAANIKYMISIDEIETGSGLN